MRPLNGCEQMAAGCPEVRKRLDVLGLRLINCYRMARLPSSHGRLAYRRPLTILSKVDSGNRISAIFHVKFSKCMTMK